MPGGIIMAERLPFIISISRQMGCGGAYIGQSIAGHFGISYIDKELIKQASREMKIKEEMLEKRDEKRSWLDSLLKAGITKAPLELMSDEPHPPSVYDLFEVEANIIRRIAKDYSAVIVGRCGGYTLKDFLRNISIFLYADNECRIKNVCDYHKVDEAKARKMIEDNDRSRGRYHKDYTGYDWFDSRQYHLTLDTGRVGFEGAKDIIINYVNEYLNTK
jgi:cytidylate kinase